MRDTVSTVRRTAVVGGGYMGAGMAQCFILAGYECSIADIDAASAQAAKERLVAETRQHELDGLVPRGSADRIADLLEASATIENAVANADYVAEVVSEDVRVKSDVLARIAAAARPDAVITSNTSAIPIGLLAEAVAGPERFLGAHWMNPAPFVPCVEVIPTDLTAEWAIEVTERLLASLGKVTSRVSDVAGFVANRLQFALFQESLRMVDEGSATPALIDEVVSNSFGFRLPLFGPFAAADIAGLDVYVGAYESLSRAYGERFAVPASLAARVAAGDLGMKRGGGFTGFDASQREAVAQYRNRAYVALAKLREELGPRPWLVPRPRYRSLITVDELQPLIERGDVVILDARFDIDDEESAAVTFTESHLPGARQADVARHMAGTVIPGVTGRRPLPTTEAFTQTLRSWGVTKDVQVVIYDGMNGIMAGSRLWTMLRWAGIDDVALLDGGFQAWLASGLPLEKGPGASAPSTFTPQFHDDIYIDVSEVEEASESGRLLLLDSRSLTDGVPSHDAIKGHIPGSRAADRARNSDATAMRWRGRDELNAHFVELIGDRDPSEVVFYCGSGITAAQNLVGMAHAGLDGARMYVGSWSEWITDPERAIDDSWEIGETGPSSPLG